MRDPATKPLKRWSTDELETAIYSGRLDNLQRFEAERILSASRGFLQHLFR